jgi:hypothetical protein
MKKIVIIFICLLYFLFNADASSFIIDNDTIHQGNGKYYVISNADTFDIDTTLIFIKYSVNALAIDKIHIEDTYGLRIDHEFTFGWSSYNYDLQHWSYYQILSSLESEQLIESLDFNTSVHFACDELESSDEELSGQ